MIDHPAYVEPVWCQETTTIRGFKSVRLPPWDSRVLDYHPRIQEFYITTLKFKCVKLPPWRTIDVTTMLEGSGVLDYHPGAKPVTPLSPEDPQL
jgi:hypothetical protein